MYILISTLNTIFQLENNLCEFLIRTHIFQKLYFYQKPSFPFRFGMANSINMPLKLKVPQILTKISINCIHQTKSGPRIYILDLFFVLFETLLFYLNLYFPTPLFLGPLIDISKCISLSILDS